MTPPSIPARKGAGEFTAIALMIAASVIFAFNDVWLRRIADDIGLAQTIWGRSVLFLVIISLSLSASDRRALAATPNLHLQIARGVFPIIGAFLMIGAMARIPVADAAATFFMSPLFAVVFAIPLLGERVRAATWIALAIGFAGMLVIVRPGSGNFEWAHLWALAAAVDIAFYQIFTSLVARDTSAKATLFFMACTASAITSCIVPFTWTTPDRSAWLGLLGTAICYAVGHGMYIRAHSRLPASRLAPFMYFQLIGAIGAAFYFYGQLPSPYMMLGGAMIVAGGLIALLSRARRAAPPPGLPLS